MKLEELSREELIERLQSLLEERHSLDSARESLSVRQERVLYDLRVHQVELEVQNRNLLETQASLEESRSRYVELYDFAPVAYATLDAKGCIQEINLTGVTMLGRDRSKLLGMPFLSVVKMEDPPAFWSHLRRCVQARAPLVSELSFSTQQSGAIDVQMVSTPVLDLAGQAKAFRTTFTNITERKRAERELQRMHELEKRLRARFEALDHAGLALTTSLARISTAGIRDFLQTIVDEARTITDADFAAFGQQTDPSKPFSPWVFSGMSAETAAAIGTLPRPVGVLGTLVAAGQTTRLRDLREHPAFRGFPSHHPVMRSFLGMPVRYGDEVLGNLYLANKRGAEEFTDDDERALEILTARIGLAMEVARLNQRLAEAVRAREDLLAVVVHDLRTPLASIQLCATMLAREPDAGGDQSKSKKHVERIQRASQGMNRLIEDLLHASTIEAGRFTVDARPTDVVSAIADAVQEMSPLAASKSLRFDTEVSPDLPAASCDRPRILQVISNLVGNAIKFTQPGGSIGVRVMLIESELRFAVSDTGSGIAESEVPHLFDRYWKGRPSTRQGTGLGLYIAKGIVEAHGGRLWVETKVGIGSTFFFTLPVAQESRTAVRA